MTKEEIIENQQRLIYLLSCAPAVIYSFEAKGDFCPTFISENIKELFGYEPHEYMNDHNFVKGHVHPDDGQRIQKEQSHLFEVGRLVLEYRFLCKNDHYCWVGDEMRLIRDKNGEPLEVVGSWSDITAKKHINDALVTAENRLSHVLSVS
ncbi:MAG: PAS domain-containing protein, partial [Gammaproteobacteria bacterium]|nr:PAS domain-containing protein [Gammaproteobacteria bacterium]